MPDAFVGRASRDDRSRLLPREIDRRDRRDHQHTPKYRQDAYALRPAPNGEIRRGRRPRPSLVAALSNSVAALVLPLRTISPRTVVSFRRVRTLFRERSSVGQAIPFCLAGGNRRRVIGARGAWTCP